MKEPFYRVKYRLRNRPIFSYTNPEGWTGTTEEKALGWIDLNYQTKEILEFIWGLERKLTDLIKNPETSDEIKKFLTEVLMERDTIDKVGV